MSTETTPEEQEMERVTLEIHDEAKAALSRRRSRIDDMSDEEFAKSTSPEHSDTIGQTTDLLGRAKAAIADAAAWHAKEGNTVLSEGLMPELVAEIERLRARIAELEAALREALAFIQVSRPMSAHRTIRRALGEEARGG